MMMNEGFGESRAVIMRRQQGLEGFRTHGLSNLPTWKLSAWHGLKGDERAPCRVPRKSECVYLGRQHLLWRIESCKARAVPGSENGVQF